MRNNIRCLPPDFLYRGNIELYECPVKFWNYFGFVWPFLYMNWVSGHLMWIFKFELQAHAPVHQSWLKNHMCVLGWISRSHARNGNEIQTSGHRGSAENIEKLGFKILVNPKHAWKSWNLAWCHVMVLPCCGKRMPNRNKFLYKLLANWSFSQEDSCFREGTCHLCVRNDILSPPLIFFTEAT